LVDFFPKRSRVGTGFPPCDSAIGADNFVVPTGLEQARVAVTEYDADRNV